MKIVIETIMILIIIIIIIITQVAPKGPKTYPGSSRDPPELSEGPPGRPESHETSRKSTNTQVK